MPPHESAQTVSERNFGYRTSEEPQDYARVGYLDSHIVYAILANVEVILHFARLLWGQQLVM
jgi:hypothetical protein